LTKQERPRVGLDSLLPLDTPKPRSRSGPNLTEARRRELGYGSIKVRLPLDVLKLLAEESERSGWSRAELLDACIRLYLGTDELAIECRAGRNPPKRRGR